MYIPTTPQELASLSWEKLDIILITGDSYIDSPHIGIALIGKLLIKAGYRVGIIAQPDLKSPDDIKRLGEPALFWGVSGGSVDSMVANYTAIKKWRKHDDYTPGGDNNKRPDRAVIAYSNLIRTHFKNTVPIVLGGIEASLRRVSHYDFWSNKIRRSILFDSRADYLVYGMGEKTIIELAETFKNKNDVNNIRGLCYKSKNPVEDYIELPDHVVVVKNKNKFIEMFKLFYDNNDALKAKGLYQKQDTRYLVQNPPAVTLNQNEMDDIYDLDFERDLHPYYAQFGKVKALETIRFSYTTHRGCYGECNFCSIAVHQGRTIQWRSEDSIIKEVNKISKFEDFKGYVYDGGTPTANMYGYECKKKLKSGACQDKSCIGHSVCISLRPSHSRQINLLKKLRKINGVKKVFVTAGIRYDIILDDEINGLSYLEKLVNHHVSGQLKIAPEHTEDAVLKMMRKPGKNALFKFHELYEKANRKANKNQFLTYYLIAAHPGCTETHMESMKKHFDQKLKIKPEQVQIYTPLPSTYSALMYYTETDPKTGEKIFVEKDISKKEKQKLIVTAISKSNKKFKSNKKEVQGAIKSKRKQNTNDLKKMKKKRKG